MIMSSVILLLTPFILASGSSLDFSETSFRLKRQTNSKGSESRLISRNHTHEVVDFQFYTVIYHSPSKKELEKRWVYLPSILASNPLTPGSLNHPNLTDAWRRAVHISLQGFEFPFYGNPIRNATIATGGFSYVGEHVHSWLAATQYIAPLMAGFESFGPDSSIRYAEAGDKLVIEWNNVTMRKNLEQGQFTFQLIVQRNGDIFFLYKDIPTSFADLDDILHPKKAGISDAYLLETPSSFGKNRKVIYKYHRIKVDKSKIKTGAMIEFRAKPQCISLTSPEECLSEKNAALQCSWCIAPDGRSPFCSNSDGTHRRRQDWMDGTCRVAPSAGLKIAPNTFGSTTTTQLPSKLDVYPDSVSITDCVQSKDGEIFHENAFQGVERSVGELVIKDCARMDKFPLAVRELRNLRTLTIQKTGIDAVANRDLKDLTQLTSLDLTENRIYSMENDSLLNQRILLNLTLRRNYLSSEVLTPVSKLRALKNLDLSANRIDALSADQPFRGLNFLKSLKMNRNSLTKLEAGNFGGLDNLEELDLRVNLIEKIQANSFVGLKRLKSLRLDGNYLTTLDSDSFKGLNNLNEIGLSFEELKEISTKPFDSLESLEILDLHNNPQLNNLSSDTFSNLRKLRVANFTNNRLMAKISSTDFHQVIKLDSLDLSKTGIGSLDYHILNKTQQINVSGVAWHCDHNIIPFHYWILERYRRKVEEDMEFPDGDIVEAQCSTPSDKENTKIRDLNLMELMKERDAVIAETVVLAAETDIPKTTSTPTTTETPSRDRFSQMCTMLRELC